MTRYVTPAHVSENRRDMHDLLALACREYKSRGGRVTGANRHKRYMALREAFGVEE